MRVAVVSDIHGNLVALEAVARDLERLSPDLVIHGGDLALIGPRPRESVDFIRAAGWQGVLGNTDHVLYDRPERGEQEARAPALRAWLTTLLDELLPWARARVSQDQVKW